MREIFIGVVQKGKGYASRLGFPTINIPLDTKLSGIFAARVTIKEGEVSYAAAVFADPTRKILEAHILDFPPKDGSLADRHAGASGGQGNLVGQEVTIELVEKLRETEIFETEEKLKTAISRDIEATRAYFKKT